jgi:C-terminal processing protease CtpA/Prc
MMLDALLPKCETSRLVFSNGKYAAYYSDKKQVKFKKIIILVNEKSASCSELLTLCLNKSLNNVVVVGHPTFGKGVGQQVYEDREDKYMIYLTSFYWEVKKTCIAGSRIYPEITVKGSSDSDYFNVVDKQIK